MYESLAEQATESGWSQEERDQWYRERPKDEEYYRIQRELLKDGLTRKAKLVKLPPHEEGQPGLCAIGLESRRRDSAAPAWPSRTSSPRNSCRPWRTSGARSGRRPSTSTSSPAAAAGAVPEVGPRGQLGECPASPGEQLLWSAETAAHQLLVKHGGAKTQRLPRQALIWPSARLLGFIQEGEPLNLELPNRKASIYTSSHFYLDDYPNAPEPISDAPMPHTQLNPAASFETADEGYEGVPFPRPPREFTSFLPDSDDGGMDPGQALRNDGLSPGPRRSGADCGNQAFRRLRRSLPEELQEPQQPARALRRVGPSTP